MTFEERTDGRHYLTAAQQDIIADWKAEREELISQLAKARELEKGISKIIDCIAKVSVDIHHSGQEKNGEARRFWQRRRKYDV